MKTGKKDDLFVSNIFWREKEVCCESSLCCGVSLDDWLKELETVECDSLLELFKN